MNFFGGAWPFKEDVTDVFTHQSAAYQNRLRVLSAICRRECLSQRQLAFKTKLRSSTISNIIRDLGALGLVQEGVPIEERRAGPKEKQLEIVPSVAWGAGLNLNPNGHRLMILNAMGHILTQETFSPGLGLEELIKLLPDKLTQVSRQLGLERIPLAGLGVSAPGVVNAETGEILVSRSLNLRSRPLQKEWQQVLGCPVFVERNVICGAYAEHQAGSARERDSYLYFLLQSHPGHARIFGLALVINQRIFRGYNSAAGEVSQELLPQLAAYAPAQQTEAEIDAYYEACATALSGITNLFDVGSLILCSDDQHLTPRRFETMRTRVIDSLVPVPGRRFDFIRSVLDVGGMTLGAGLLVLHRFLAARLASRQTPRNGGGRSGGKGVQRVRAR